MRLRLRFLEFDYETVYRPGRVHQMPDALSRLILNGEQDEDSEIDDALPTFPVRKEAMVEDILNVLLVVTRLQTRKQTKPAKKKDEQQNKQGKASQEACAGQHATAPNPWQANSQNQDKSAAFSPRREAVR